MKRQGSTIRTYLLVTATLVVLQAKGTLLPAAEQELRMVVMDPLAAPLSCPCVAGYAQRDYEKLATFLGSALGCEVTTSFTESLQSDGKLQQEADIVIGKRSVVEADSGLIAAAGGPPMVAVASLTDREGTPWQQGLIVVHRDDTARSIADLQQHTILLGPADSAEKHAAARRLFAQHGRTLGADTVCSAACTDGAAAVIEAAKAGGPPTAAVISSYAQPLLEGCGAIRRGDLRVVARTTNVPFVTAFVSQSLPAAVRQSVTDALLSVGGEPLLLLALESQRGFLPLVEPPPETASGPR